MTSSGFMHDVEISIMNQNRKNSCPTSTRILEHQRPYMMVPPVNQGRLLQHSAPVKHPNSASTNTRRLERTQSEPAKAAPAKRNNYHHSNQLESRSLPSLSAGKAGSQQQQQQQQQSSMEGTARYKTELCRPYNETGMCRYGSKCQFAHGYDELRNLSRHPKYKTELCRTFHSTGFCSYGQRCNFIHNDEDQPSLPPTTSQSPARLSPCSSGSQRHQSLSIDPFTNSTSLLTSGVKSPSSLDGGAIGLSVPVVPVLRPRALTLPSNQRIGMVSAINSHHVAPKEPLTPGEPLSLSSSVGALSYSSMSSGEVLCGESRESSLSGTSSPSSSPSYSSANSAAAPGERLLFNNQFWAELMGDELASSLQGELPPSSSQLQDAKQQPPRSFSGSYYQTSGASGVLPSSSSPRRDDEDLFSGYTSSAVMERSSGIYGLWEQGADRERGVAVNRPSPDHAAFPCMQQAYHPSATAYHHQYQGGAPHVDTTPYGALGQSARGRFNNSPFNIPSHFGGLTISSS